MKLLVDAEHLDATLSALVGMIPQNALIPILASIKLATGPDSLTLTGNSMDCLAAITMPASILEPGEVAIEAERLRAFADGLKGKASLETDAKGAIAKCNRRTAKLAVLPPEEFPDLPFEGDDPCEFDLSAEAVATISDLIFAAAPRDASRPFLQGAHIFGRDGALVTEAGTGMIFAQFILPDACTIPPEWSIIIPRETLPYLKRLFPEGCHVKLSQTKLEATDAAVRFVSKLAHGPYPNTEQFIPAPAEGLVIKCDAEELASIATKVVAMAGADTNWLTLFPRGDHVLLSASNKAEAEDIVAGECSGNIDQLTLSTKVLIPLLQGFGASSVIFSQGISGEAVRLDSVAQTDRVGIVMPVRFRAAERMAA